MTLREWNKAVQYAEQQAEELTKEGISCKAIPYTVDGEDGIWLTILDRNGRVYEQYASGIWSNGKELIAAIGFQAKRIRKEQI